MNHMKHVFNGLLVGLLALVVFLQPVTQLKADSANLTFGTESPITSDRVDLQIGGNIPTTVSSFVVYVNYNSDAFTYISGSGATGSISVSQESNGIAVIRGNGTLSGGNHLLATITLQAKAPGVATVVLTRSSFTDTSGNTIPGTLLRYYTLNMQDPVTTTSTTREATLATTTSLETEGTTAANTAEETTIPHLTTAPSSLSSETSLETSIPEETSTSDTTETGLQTTATSDAVIPTETNERSNFLGGSIGPLLVILGIIALILVVIIATISKRKNKRQ